MRIISQLPRKRLVFYILLLITASFIESIHAGQLNRSECKFAAAWFEHNIKSTPKEPFSFRYGRQASNELITDWNREIKLLGSQNQRSEYKIVYSDPLGKLRLVLHADVYTDFPAVEWVLELENCGADTTEIFDNILVADLLLSALKSESVILHHATGSDHRIDDFAPLTTIIQPGQQVRMAPKGGRSSDETAFPFFNVEQDNQGVGVGIGWTGQWAAELDRNANGTLTLQVGMERTHLRLYSGEKIRTPRILLLFWQGSDRMRGHNLMRQFMLAHHTPQIDGKPAAGPFACNGGATMFNEYTLATEHNMIGLAERYQQFGLHFEYWWIDAGWYGSMDFEGGTWHQNVGNWYIRKEHFPNGLKPVSDAMNNMGMKFILWFEPERVYKNTWLFNEHPEWLLRLENDPNNSLLDLGNPKALQWLIEYISGMISENNIAVYRQDFNIRPLGFWQAADSPDRIGMTEIKYIEGLYRFWDELRKRHPQLIIDNCASGGRRLDLETASRSIPLWRSDYHYTEPNGQQNHTYGLSFYLPCHGTGCFAPEIYRFRSAMSSSLVCGWNLYEEKFPIERAQYLLNEYKKIRPYFLGDFYPLTPFSKSFSSWMSYQFHRDDLKEGMVLFFRRPECNQPDQHVRLHGLNEKANYELFYEDFGTAIQKTGNELMETGITVRLLEKNSSLLITYREE